MSHELQAFWVDHEYDRECASDGRSRFAAYLRQAGHRFTQLFTTFDDPDDVELLRAEFAMLAWQTASSPVMAPGYVRSHQRVTSVDLCWNYQRGGLAAEISLVADRPRSLSEQWGWCCDVWWRDWPTTGAVEPRFYRPEASEEDLAQVQYLLTTVTATFAVDTNRLPLPVLGLVGPLWLREIIESAAVKAVDVLVGQLNQRLAPILRTLEGRS